MFLPHLVENGGDLRRGLAERSLWEPTEFESRSEFKLSSAPGICLNKNPRDKDAMNTSQNSRAHYAERLLPTPQGTGELQNMSIPPGSPEPAPVETLKV